MKKFTFLIVLFAVFQLASAQGFKNIFSDTALIKKNLWKKERLSYYINSDTLNLNNFSGYFQRGFKKMRENLYKEAIADFRKSITEDKVFTNNIPALKKDGLKNDALFYIASCYLLLEDMDSALFYYQETISNDPFYIDAYLQIASVYQASDNKNLMIESIKTGIENNPGSAELHYNLGIAYLINDQKHKVKRTQKYLIEEFPKYEKSYVLLGLVYLFEGKNYSAINTFSQSIEINPDYAMAYYLRGGMYMAQGDDFKAYDDFRKYLEYDTINAELIYNVGKLDFKYGDDSVGLSRLYQNIRLELADSIEYQFASPIKRELLYLLSVANSDTIYAGETAYVKAYYHKAFDDNLKAAKEILDEYLKRFPNSYFAKRFVLNKYCLNYSAYEFNFDTETMLAVIDEIIEIYPKDANFRVLKGDIYDNDEMYKEALSAYQEGGRLMPEYFYPLVAEAGTYDVLKMYDSAINCYNRIIEQYPDELIYYYNRLKVYRKMTGKQQEALDDYRHLLPNIPENIIKGNLLLEMVEIFFEMRDHDSAVLYLNNLHTENPNNTLIIETRGTAYFNLGKFNNAIDDYAAVIKVYKGDYYPTPQLSEVYFKRGNSYFYSGIYHKALKDYKDALKMYEQSPILEGAIGDCYRKLGEYEKSINHYDKALANDSQNKWYHFKKAVSLSEGRQYKAGIKCFSDAILIDSLFAEAYGHIGWNYYILGKFTQSVHFSRKALSIEPTAHYASYTIALAIMRLGYYDRAYEIFEQTKPVSDMDENPDYDRYIHELKVMLGNEDHKATVQKILTEVFGLIL